MMQQALVGGGRLHHAAARRQIAGEHRGGALGIKRLLQRMDDVGQMHLGARDIVADGAPAHGDAGQIEQIAHLPHQRPQAAGIEEVLHQIFSGRRDIGDHRHLSRDRVEARHVEREADAARHGDDMDDGVGRAAKRHMDADGVIEGGRRQNLFRRLILPHHVDGAAAGGGAHARMIGVRRRDRRRAGQREPERLGDRHHGRRGAHHHAGAERARNAAFDLVPLVVADAPGAFLVPVFPGVRAGTERLAAPIAAQHRTGRHIDRRNAHRNRAHDQARRGLVAAAHQNRAVDRMAAQQLLAFHGEKIAIEHGRRLDEGLGKRHRRQLDRKPAGLIDAAFDVLGAIAQMPMAGVDLAPGIDDADHRLADPIGAVVAELAQPRAMAERAQIVLAEPAVAAQLFGRFSVCGCHSKALTLGIICTKCALNPRKKANPRGTLPPRAAARSKSKMPSAGDS